MASGLSPAPAPQAFVFESGTLEIGEFDPYTLGDNIFDPCTEITPAEFAAAGFERVEPLPDEYAGLARGLSYCEVFDADGVPRSDFTMTAVNRDVIQGQRTVVQGVTSGSLPSAFAYLPTGGSSGCFAQVDTVRGGLSAGASSLPGDDNQVAACWVAMGMLDDLFAANH